MAAVYIINQASGNRKGILAGDSEGFGSPCEGTLDNKDVAVATFRDREAIACEIPMDHFERVEGCRVGHNWRLTGVLVNFPHLAPMTSGNIVANVGWHAHPPVPELDGSFRSLDARVPRLVVVELQDLVPEMGRECSLIGG